MAAIQLELNHGAMRDLLRSPATQNLVEGVAARIAQAAGPGHRVDSHVGAARARAAVITDTFDAMYQEATGRNLTRAVDAGRA